MLCGSSKRNFCYVFGNGLQLKDVTIIQPTNTIVCASHELSICAVSVLVAVLKRKLTLVYNSLYLGECFSSVWKVL